MKLPEAERLEKMYRGDNYTQYWLVNLGRFPNAGADLKAVLSPNPNIDRRSREIVYLGRGYGYAWYAYATIYTWTHAQRELHLEGGDDPLPAAVRVLTTEDPGDLYNCATILAQAGARGIPYIEKVLGSAPDLKTSLVYALGESNDRQVTEWLLRQVSSSDAQVARAARRGLIQWPRKEAAPLYAKWLAEDAGKEDVVQEGLMNACKAVAAPGVEKIVPRILEAPRDVWEYREVYQWWRELSGRPISQPLLDQEKRIWQQINNTQIDWEPTGDGEWKLIRVGPGYDQKEVDAAVAALVRSDDPDAAAVIALKLATYSGSKYSSYLNPPVWAAGLTILRGLPDEKGKQLVARLAKSVRAEWSRAELRGIAAKLDVKP